MNDTYQNFKTYFGDLHNHCAISYAHGSLEDALKNAREQLDFVSITGHAHWPDMPDPDPRIQYIIDFHEEGFAKLKQNWQQYLETVKDFTEDGSFIAYPGFEIHFNSVGDRTIVYKGDSGDILYADSIEDLENRLANLRADGQDTMSFPHHIAYRKGTRGIDWDSFNPDFAPALELLSMHGCSESNNSPRPFLHSMGGSDWESTAQYGLQQGHIFGFLGNTDHHSAHPGSYGHGVTGVWAENLSRESIWNAIYARRTFALTGDRMQLKYSLNGAAMGSQISPTNTRSIEIDLAAGGAIDYVDIVKNNTLVKRFSQTDIPQATSDGPLHTLLYVELGWGERNKAVEWNAQVELESGEIVRVEPRFRGVEVVSPVEGDSAEQSYYRSSHQQLSDTKVSFQTVTQSNPNNSTNCSQGICLECRLDGGVIKLELNGQHFEFSVEDLLKGSRTGHLGNIDSPAFRIHQLPHAEEWQWQLKWEDEVSEHTNDNYYIRVRQQNDQWAWSSPIFIRQ